MLTAAYNIKTRKKIAVIKGKNKPMKGLSVHFGRITALAGAYVACVIGSGFATGQEIIQFFSGHGTKSVTGTLISGALFAWIGATLMKHGCEHQLDTPEKVLTYYFGKRLGKVAGFFILLFLYSVFAVMIAGAGATLNEYFGLPMMAGRILIAVLSLATVVSGLQKAGDILAPIGMVIIAFTLITGIVSILKNPQGIAKADEIISTLSITRAKGGWFISALLYPAYNSVSVLFLACCLGAVSRNKKEAVTGGILGGILLTLAIFTMNLGLISDIGNIFAKNVPTLVLADKISSIAGIVFSVIICCGTYTTAAPMLWGITRQFAEDRTEKSLLVATALTAVGLILGMTDFRVLVNVIYPYSGYAGILLMMVVAYKDVCEIIKSKKNKKRL